ncbi:MAG: hypothetical protein RIQ70_315 [Bacteroidota bacterium]|jgi:mRNA interferase MazF
MYNQGDIVVVNFPFTDDSAFKKRPALIISNATINKTGDYILVQITSKINTDALSITIEDSDWLNPLPLKSFIRIHKIFTVHDSLILSKITTAKSEFLKVVSYKIYGLIKVKG